VRTENRLLSGVDVIYFVLLKEADDNMRRSWSRIFAVTLGIPLLLAFLVACGSGTTGTTGSGTTPTATKIIKIGSDLPVSGKDESSGLPAQDGAALALNQANANHTIPGYQLVFVPKDDVGPSGIHDPAQGAQNVTALIGDALVAGIVGPFNSNVAEAEMPITDQAPIAQISPANTNTCLTQDTADTGCTGKNDILKTVRPTGKVTYFRIATTDNHQGGVGADYLYKTLNYHKAYVIDDAETYGIGIANAFIKEFGTDGGTVLGHSSEPSTTTSYVSLLTQVAAMHPDVIYFAGLDSTGGILVRKQMEQIPGLQNTPYAGGDGLQTSTFASTIGVNGGPIYSTVATANADVLPEAQTFISQFKQTYGASAYGAYSAAAYDCMNIMIQAIKTAIQNGATPPTSSSDTSGASTFRQDVINAIQGISYNGVTGHQSFDQNGDTTDKVISIYQLAEVSGSPSWKFITQQTIA
jgi:branched-chain amino acid transport system substrate-binding protein